MNSELVKSIVTIIFSILSIVISRYIIPWIKIKYDNEKSEKISRAVTSAVCAAEQVITSPGSGAEKKKQVVEYVTTWLNNEGIKLSEKDIDNLIEAIVYEMKNDSKKE